MPMAAPGAPEQSPSLVLRRSVRVIKPVSFAHSFGRLFSSRGFPLRFLLAEPGRSAGVGTGTGGLAAFSLEMNFFQDAPLPWTASGAGSEWGRARTSPSAAYGLQHHHHALRWPIPAAPIPSVHLAGGQPVPKGVHSPPHLLSWIDRAANRCVESIKESCGSRTRVRFCVGWCRVQIYFLTRVFAQSRWTGKFLPGRQVLQLISFAELISFAACQTTNDS